MNNEWAFLPMRSSNGLLGDAPAMQERLDEDSYLYFEGILDPSRVRDLGAQVADCLEECGWLARAAHGPPLCKVPPFQEGEPEYFDAYDRVQRLESLHGLALDEDLTRVMADILGGPVFPHPLKIARLVFPGNYENSTPPHQDYPNNQGTESLTATWIPLHDLPAEMGGIAVLRGSHRYGMFPVASHWGPGNRYAVVPESVMEECRWVTTTFSAGDVLVFPSMTVHAATHNASETFMRLSVDFRFQREGEPLTPIVLEPHFKRASWDEIYQAWESTTGQYYWREHDYEVVPFEEFELADDGLTHEPLREHVDRERRQNARLARRSDLAPQPADD